MFKTALITGATRGIGLAISARLASFHDELIMIYGSNDTAASEAREKLLPLCKNIRLIKVDLSNPDNFPLLDKQLSDSYDDITTLVNNAGAITMPGAWNEQPSADFRKSFEVNFFNAVELIRLIAPAMQKNKFGRIINMASTYGLDGAAPVLSYTCAKSAMITLTTAMAKELAKDGITVNAISPGNIDTDMTAAAGPEFLEWIISNTPVGRLGKVDEVANAAEYLIKSEFITGTNQILDGGFSIR